MDHIIPKAQGGKDEYKNLQLLHGHCHDTKTKEDNLITQELKDEAKIPELKKLKTDLNVMELEIRQT